MKTTVKPARDSRLPHRLAVVLCCATFPLIWVGGLVTTYDAGMAVPDWPTTYGYNLFAYPLSTWVAGPWDLFIEHGHRLLGALVGLIAIALAVTVTLRDDRRWVHAMAWGALALVIVQGLLGGARVVMDERTIAMVHACVGPAFFAYAVAMSVVLSRVWRGGAVAVATRDDGSSLRRLAMLTAIFALVQLLLGAQLRHVPVTASAGFFRAVVFFHVVMAFVLAGHALALTRRVTSNYWDHASLFRPATVLAALLVGQLLLGVGTWVTKYGWPVWFADLPFAAGYTVQAHSLVQSLVVTSHVAIGSLILATATMLTMRSFRLVRVPAAAGSSALLVGCAT